MLSAFIGTNVEPLEIRYGRTIMLAPGQLRPFSSPTASDRVA
jgi:hypothetical protein